MCSDLMWNVCVRVCTCRLSDSSKNIGLMTQHLGKDKVEAEAIRSTCAGEWLDSFIIEQKNITPATEMKEMTSCWRIYISSWGKLCILASSFCVCHRHGSGSSGSVSRVGRQREGESTRGLAEAAPPPEWEEEEPHAHRALHHRGDSQTVRASLNRFFFLYIWFIVSHRKCRPPKNIFVSTKRETSLIE